MAPQYASGARAGRFPGVRRQRTVHVNRNDALRHLLRIFERAAVDDRIGIEEDKIRFRTGAQHAAIAEAEFLCRKARHPPDAFGERKQVLIARIMSEHARKRAVEPGMRLALQRWQSV